MECRRGKGCFFRGNMENFHFRAGKGGMKSWWGKYSRCPLK
jgi:hypothetical protein